MSLNGFFQGTAEAPATKSSSFLSPRCGQCGLARKCRSPKMPVAGEGRRKILLVGEGPGENEDLQGKHFVGKAGQFLQRRLDDVGIDLFRDCWVTNAVRCRPTNADGKNRAPTDKEIAWCRPWLSGNGDPYGDVARLKPEIIILLGAPAVKSVLGWLWKEDVGSISRWIGWRIPCQKVNAWICPAWHPSHVMREEDNPLVEATFARHLQAAAELKGRPWKEVPDYASQVVVELSSNQAAQVVGSILGMKLPTAVDLETTCLKPDGPAAEIYSCSVSNGALTVSFPWLGKARQAACELMASGLPKVAYNAKFETRWFLAKESVKARNWVWDGMLAAHVLDNRPDVTSLKFQAFVQLGQASWDDHVKPCFQSAGPNSPNRIKKMDLRKLLEYGGIDALLELEVAKVQAKRMGVALY